MLYMTCPNCGVELDNDVTECYLCGYILLNGENHVDSDYNEQLDNNSDYNDDNICPTCGYLLNESELVCPICGTQIERQEIFNEESTISSEENLSENTDTESTDEVKTEQKSKTPLKISLVIIIILCLLLCCVVCLMAKSIFDNKDDKIASSNTDVSSIATTGKSSSVETTTTTATTQTTTSKETKKSVSKKLYESEFEPYIIRVINPISIYDTPSYSGKITGTIDDGLKYTIVKEYYDSSNELWGKLKSGMGWINIDDATYDIKTEEPNVWCPECGEGFFTTGIGTDGLTCPNCGYNWFPDDVDYTDYNEYIWNRHSVKNDFGGDEYLDGYTEEEIQTFINEILANNGYKFKEKKWINYFSKYDWYYPDTSNLKTVVSRFNDCEKENYYYLAKYRDKKFK